MSADYDAAIARAVASLAGATKGDDASALDRLNRATKEAVGLRGGLHDGGRLVDKDIMHGVIGEVLDRFMAKLAAEIGPRIDAKISPEAGTAVDEELAQIRAELAALLSRLG